MNNRIRDIQILAADKVNKTYIHTPGEYYEYEWQERFVEEFGKLLVRECASWIGDMQYDDGSCVKSLLKEFGAENE